MKNLFVSIAVIATATLGGCGGVSFNDVLTDVKGWATAANVLWTDVNAKKPVADIKTDLVAGGVSPETADKVIAWAGPVEGFIAVTPSLVSIIDALVKAASGK